MLSKVAFILLSLYTIEYIFEFQSALFDKNNYHVPCYNSVKQFSYNDGHIWFANYNETTNNLRNEILSNFTSNLMFLQPTILNTSTIFQDNQMQYLSSDIDKYINYSHIIRNLQEEICNKTNMPFYVSSGIHNSWILDYNKIHTGIDAHVDNEILPVDGLTVIITLYNSHADTIINYNNSVMTRSDVITFVPHIFAPHHTPIVNHNDGRRIVYQMRGSSHILDTPIHFIMRKIKNIPYLGFPSLLIPFRLVTMYKRFFFSHISHKVNSIFGLKINLTLDEQRISAIIIRFFGHVIGHYGKYLFYCIGFLYPELYKNKYRFWMRLMQSLWLISLFTQFYVYYNNVHFYYMNLGCFIFGQLLFVAGMIRIGGDATFLGSYIMPNYKETYTTRFPYNISNHPQYVGSLLSYMSLLYGSNSLSTTSYIIIHIMFLHLWMSCEIYSTKIKQNDVHKIKPE